MEKVAVVIPCYKVKKFILHIISSIGDFCDVIFVVDDCCPEKSGEYVINHCRDKRVHVLINTENLGVGGAVRRGYQEALRGGATVIVKLDGDGQMDPSLIPYFVRPILEGEADYTKGNRFYDLKSILVMPKIRILGNAVLSFMTKFSSGYWHIFDPTNGYTAFSLSLLLFVIVRPILLPFITLIFGVTLIYALEHKEARRVLFTLIFVFTVPFASLSLFSQYKFNDARLISGTYSEISLFCAWNDFLPLTRHYNSGLWKKLPEVEYETALKILHNDSGWEMRAVKLRKEVLKFIISNPMKACKGYIWRLGKFSINVDNSSKLYKLLFFAWSLTAILVILFSLQMMVFKEKITFCIVTLLPSFIILVTALFSFIGNRYYLTPGFSLLFALAFNIAILKGETSAGRCLLKI